MAGRLRSWQRRAATAADAVSASDSLRVYEVHYCLKLGKVDLVRVREGEFAGQPCARPNK
jgi:hypothetical protein